MIFLLIPFALIGFGLMFLWQSLPLKRNYVAEEGLGIALFQATGIGLIQSIIAFYFFYSGNVFIGLWCLFLPNLMAVLIFGVVFVVGWLLE